MRKKKRLIGNMFEHELWVLSATELAAKMNLGESCNYCLMKKLIAFDLTDNICCRTGSDFRQYKDYRVCPWLLEAPSVILDMGILICKWAGWMWGAIISHHPHGKRLATLPCRTIWGCPWMVAETIRGMKGQEHSNNWQVKPRLCWRLFLRLSHSCIQLRY